MSDQTKPESDCSYFSNATVTIPPQEFRLLLKDILQWDLSKDELETFQWTLKLPKKLLEETVPPIAIIRYLEEKHHVENWDKDPMELIRILEQALPNRNDLATKIRQWSDTKYLSTTLKPEIRLFKEEEDEETGEHVHHISSTPAVSEQVLHGELTSYSNKLHQRSPQNPLESVQEKSHSTIAMNPTSQEEMKLETDLELSEPVFLRLPNSHIRLGKTVSNASSGYFSDRNSLLGSNRFSGLSIASVCSEIEKPTEQNLVGQCQELTVPSKSTDFLHSAGKGMESRDECTTSLSARPHSPSIPTEQLGVSYIIMETSEETKARQRSFCHLSNADKAARNQILSKLHDTSKNESTISSRSLFPSAGQTSTKSSKNHTGSTGGSEKTQSLRRMSTSSLSCNLITTQISIPVKKIQKDIAERNSSARTSGCFPNSSDFIQYQLRFFSSNTACALYIDVAPDYLQSLKTKSSPAETVINIPSMDATVTVDVEPNIHEEVSEVIPATCRSVQLVCSDSQNRPMQQPVIVTAFPNLLKLNKLNDFEKDVNAELVINVSLQYNFSITEFIVN